MRLTGISVCFCRPSPKKASLDTIEFMLAAITSAFRVFLRAGALEIGQMSTSVLALGVGLVVKFHASHQKGGWGKLRNELASDTWKGLWLAMKIWLCMFPFFLGSVIFGDHTSLVAALAQSRESVAQIVGSIPPAPDFEEWAVEFKRASLAGDPSVGPTDRSTNFKGANGLVIEAYSGVIETLRHVLLSYRKSVVPNHCCPVKYFV